MIVQAKHLPDFHALIQELKHRFPQYSVYSFGSRPVKSIIVRKSAVIGTQITLRENDILVDACYPNMLISSALSLLTASTLFPFESWLDFEKKITAFLKSRYGQQAEVLV